MLSSGSSSQFTKLYLILEKIRRPPQFGVLESLAILIYHVLISHTHFSYSYNLPIVGERGSGRGDRGERRRYSKSGQYLLTYICIYLLTYYTILYYTVLYYTILCYTILCYTKLYLLTYYALFAYCTYYALLNIRISLLTRLRTYLPFVE